MVPGPSDSTTCITRTSSSKTQGVRQEFRDCIPSRSSTFPLAVVNCLPGAIAPYFTLAGRAACPAVTTAWAIFHSM